MKTFSFEVIVNAKTDEKGVETRPATLVAHDEHLLVEPTREDILMKFAAEIAKLKATAKEVSVNVRPFC